MRDYPNEVIRMYGLTRATTTLLAAAVAGFLIWLAGQFSNNHEGGYWAIMGVLAGAGLVMALSQLLGGWTKWGWPRLSVAFLLLAFVPIAVASLWVVLTADRPTTTSARDEEYAAARGRGAPPPE